MADAVYRFLGMPARHLPGIQEPMGSHLGGEHHEAPAATSGGLETPLAPAGAPAATPGAPAAPGPEV